MLSRIHVQGFKSLLDVEVELTPLVVVLGPNASGKSNLLEAILLLSRLINERTLADAFEAPLRGYPAEAFSLPETGLPGLLAQDSAQVAIEADIRPATRLKVGRSESLRYRVEVSISPRTGVLKVDDEGLWRLNRHGQTTGKPRVEQMDNQLVVRRLGEAGQPRHEPLGLNHTMISNLQFSGETRYPDFDRLRQEVSSWRTYYLDPRTAMREPQPPREVEDIGPLGESIAPFLHRLKESSGQTKFLKAIGRALHAAIPTITKLNVELDRQRGTLDIQIEEDGTPFSSRVISEGTLRVMALCAVAANPWPGSLIALEEPENGVHPRRIEVIADLLLSMASPGGRQVLVTTHSPTLIAALAHRGAFQPGVISFLRCMQEGRSTRVSMLDPYPGGPLFRDEGFGDKVTEALDGAESTTALGEMLLRGWLDG